MQKFTQWILFSLILFSSVEELSAGPATKNLLQDVATEISESGLIVRFEFSKSVLFPDEPVFSDTSIQIDIPLASVRPERRFFYTGDSRIPQIVATQLDAKTLRVQFVLGEKLPRIKDNFQIEDQGRTLVARLLKKEEDVLSGFLARASARIDSQESREEANSRVSRDESVASPVQTPLTTEKDQPFKVKQVASNTLAAEALPPLRINESRGLDLNKPLDPVAVTLRTFAMFALVLALMFFIFYVFKKYVLKNTIFGGNEKFVQVLGSGFLGPKKSIVMVEVAGEVLVLGISNDNISFLTQIQDEEKIEAIKASRKESNEGSFWNSSKKNNETKNGVDGKARLEGAFDNYLKQFSGAPSEKEKTMGEVTDLIRKSIGKFKTS
jgi:flagellar protein FliO/FliZ